MFIPVIDITEIVRNHRITTRIFIFITRPEFLYIKLFSYFLNFRHVTIILYTLRSESYSIIDIFFYSFFRKVFIALIVRRKKEFANLIRKSKIWIQIRYKIKHNRKVCLVFRTKCISTYILNGRKPIAIGNNILKTSSSKSYQLRIWYKLWMFYKCTTRF